MSNIDDSEPKVLVCQNCKRTIMYSHEKYCTTCGASKDSAAFEPLRNHRQMVYGPPIKVKYECNNCKYIWIEVALGHTECWYCSQCGSDDIDLLVKKYYDHGDPISSWQPMSREEMKKPLLTEEEVKKLLEARMNLDDIEGSYNSEKIVRLGFPEAENRFEKVLTEKESERIVLALHILEMQGENPYAFSNEECTQCGSKMIAAIEYYNRDLDELPNFHTVADGTELFFPSHYGVSKEYADKVSAFKCLQCGKEFGRLIY